MRRVLFIGFAVATSCGSPLAVETDAYALMVTDAAEYRLVTVSNGIETVIRYTYSNRTGKTVSIPNCNGHVPPYLEKQVGDEWVFAWGAFTGDCLSAPITIAPGVQYRDEVRVFAGFPGSNTSPQFAVSPVAGIYRLVWDSAVWSYDHSGPPWGQRIPLSQRVSNSFLLIEPEPVMPGAWELLPTLPLPVRAAAVAASDDRIYVVGGTDTAGRTGRFQIYDVSVGSWSFGPDLPVATDWGGAVVLSGRVHFVGGVTNQVAASDQHWVYDPSSASWEGGPPLPKPAAGSAVAVLGSRFFVLGGIDGPSAHSDNTLIYDVVSSQWSEGAPVPSPRINWAGAAADAAILAVGGGTPGVETTDELVAYDPSANTWTRLSAIPQRREAHGGAVIGRLFCAAGGRLAASGNFGPPFDDVSCYSLDDQTWTLWPRLPRALQEVGVVSIGDHVYVAGGRDATGSAVSDFTRLEMR